jgi:hypothetical protein
MNDADDTITLTDLARQAGVGLATASRWLRKGLLPQPLEGEHRTREYRFLQAEALAAVARIQEARLFLAGIHAQPAG